MQKGCGRKARRRRGVLLSFAHAAIRCYGSEAPEGGQDRGVAQAVGKGKRRRRVVSCDTLVFSECTRHTQVALDGRNAPTNKGGRCACGYAVELLAHRLKMRRGECRSATEQGEYVLWCGASRSPQIAGPGPEVPLRRRHRRRERLEVGWGGRRRRESRNCNKGAGACLLRLFRSRRLQ